MRDQQPVLRLGTRGSALARRQTAGVADLLAAAWPGLVCEVIVLQTQGDRILDKPLPLVGGKGLFTAELEAALREGRIDLAVHSLKDLPTELPPGLIVGAMPVRAQPADVLVSRSGLTLQDLPRGAVIGTSSNRRAAQVRHFRPDLQILDIRGNVDTRLRKALDPRGAYDAVLLASAGLERLGHTTAITQVLPPDIMLPAPGQGALAVQCRDEPRLRSLLAPLDHAPTRQAVDAERAFLAGLGGGCAVPVAALASIAQGQLYLQGRISTIDGSRQIDVRSSGLPAEAIAIGSRLAADAQAAGAREILEDVVGRAGGRDTTA